MDLWHREQPLAQAALWPDSPGVGVGLILEAVPHLCGGPERAQSPSLARGSLIAWLVPATDHRLQGEAVHVCDHPPAKTLTPSSAPKTPTPPSSVFSRFLLLDPQLEVVGTKDHPFPPKPWPSLPLSFWQDRTEVLEVLETHRELKSPSAPFYVSSYCFCPSSSLRGSYWPAIICLTKTGCAQC